MHCAKLQIALTNALDLNPKQALLQRESEGPSGLAVFITHILISITHYSKIVDSTGVKIVWLDSLIHFSLLITQNNENE